MNLFRYADVCKDHLESEMGVRLCLQDVLFKRFKARKRKFEFAELASRGLRFTAREGVLTGYEVWPGLEDPAMSLWKSRTNEVLRTDVGGARSAGVGWSRLEIDRSKVRSRFGIVVHEVVAGDLSSLVFFHCGIPSIEGGKVMIVGRGLFQLFDYCGMTPALMMTLHRRRCKGRLLPLSVLLKGGVL